MIAKVFRLPISVLYLFAIGSQNYEKSAFILFLIVSSTGRISSDNFKSSHSADIDRQEADGPHKKPQEPVPAAKCQLTDQIGRRPQQQRIKRLSCERL